MVAKYDLTNTSLIIKPEGSEEEYVIKRVKRAKLAAFVEQQNAIMTGLLLHGGYIGSFLQDTNNIKKLEAICKLIPLAEDGKFLPFSALEEDYELLTLLFFSTSFDADTMDYVVDDDVNYEPSLLHKFNFINYREVLGKLQLQVMQEKAKEYQQLRDQAKEIQTMTNS